MLTTSEHQEEQKKKNKRLDDQPAAMSLKTKATALSVLISNLDQYGSYGDETWPKSKCPRSTHRLALPATTKSMDKHLNLTPKPAYCHFKELAATALSYSSQISANIGRMAMKLGAKRRALPVLLISPTSDSKRHKQASKFDAHASVHRNMPFSNDSLDKRSAKAKELLFFQNSQSSKPSKPSFLAPPVQAIAIWSHRNIL